MTLSNANARILTDGTVQVFGSLGSGKTTLRKLLAQHIAKSEPNSLVHVSESWPNELVGSMYLGEQFELAQQLPKLPYDQFWKSPSCVWWLMNEAQDSYWDTYVWQALIKEVMKKTVPN